MTQIYKQQYLAYAAATQTVAKTKQIVLIYDGMIRFMQQAIEAIKAGQIEERYHILIKVSNIIVGLQSALDFEKGGKIAPILYSYYTNIDSKIFSIHRTNNIQTCEEVIAELKEMRDVWAEIDSGAVSGGDSYETVATDNEDEMQAFESVDVAKMPVGQSISA